MAPKATPRGSVGRAMAGRSRSPRRGPYGLDVRVVGEDYQRTFTIGVAGADSIEYVKRVSQWRVPFDLSSSLLL